MALGPGSWEAWLPLCWEGGVRTTHLLLSRRWPVVMDLGTLTVKAAGILWGAGMLGPWQHTLGLLCCGCRGGSHLEEELWRSLWQRLLRFPADHSLENTMSSALWLVHWAPAFLISFPSPSVFTKLMSAADLFVVLFMLHCVAAVSFCF